MPNNLQQLLRLNNKTDNSVSNSGTHMNNSASRMHPVNNINTQNLVESQSSGPAGVRRMRMSGQEFVEDSETPDHETLGQRTIDGTISGSYKRNIVMPLNPVHENVQFRTAKMYSGNLKRRAMAVQTKPVSPGESLQGRLFQINLREEVQGLKPAVVMRQGISHTSQGPRPKKQPNGVSHLYINANVHLQSEKALDSNRFSSSGTRKTMREKAISGIKSMRSSEDRSGQISPPKSPTDENQHSSQYNRRLMTQRFTHRGSHQQPYFQHTEVSTLKISDTPRGEANFPRLNVKSGSRKMRVPHIKQLDQMYSRTNTTGIIIQEQKQNGAQTILMHQLSARNHKALSEQNVFFDPLKRHQHLNTDIAQYTDGMGNPVYFRRDLTNRQPLVDFELENEGLSDEDCIVKNSYNVVKTTHPYHSRRSTAQHNRAVFKVVSQTTTHSNSKPRFGDDSTENSIRERNDNRSNRLSSALSEQENMQFHPDGTLKPAQVPEDHALNNGFKDFITIPVYFERHERLMKRYRKRKNQKSYQMNIRPLDFIIFNGIFPRVYSIKNQLKGTVTKPLVEFNAVNLTQREIFLIKSASYLYSHEHEKAKYFLEQGIQAWPTSTFEFRFNLALYHYLTKEFSESVAINKQLLKKLEAYEPHAEATLNKILSVVLNLMLSLIKDEHRYKDVLAIQHNQLFQRIRMMTNPVNLKIQKLLNYSTAQVLKQRAQSEHGIDSSPHHSMSVHSDESNLHGATSDLQETQDTRSGKKSGHKSLSPDGSVIADHAKSKKIKYQVFQKRGSSNFPLKNIKKIEQIRVKKAIERQRIAAKTNKPLAESDAAILFGQTPRSDPPSPQLTARQKFQKVLKQNKAAFFKVESIQNVKSPDYVLSMNDIIQRLANKEDIQQNKHLMYQLTQLDEILKRNETEEEGPEGNPNREDTATQIEGARERSPIIPFPFEMSDIQKRNPLYREKVAEDVSQQEQQLDFCMRNLEELRLEVSKEYGGEFDQIDPVYSHFKVLCNSIYALLKEENLIDIIMEAKKQLREEGAVRMLSSKKVSIAKEILLSALLRRKKSRLNVKNLADDELVEIELLQENIKQLKDIMKEEQRSSMKRTQSMDFMQKIEKEINRMLVIARKKQREREKHQKQEEEDRQMNMDPKSSEHLSADYLIATKSLSSLLRRSRFQKMISERFKVEPRKYQEAFELKRGIVTQAAKFKSGDLTKEVLSKFKLVDPDQYTKLLERTKGFLSYLFDSFGGYFIANRTYCLTEFLDLAPTHIMTFFKNTANTLTTIPMRLPILADTYDDNSWSDLCAREFIYNKDDIMHKFLSEGLRYPKVIEYMGLEKHSWIVEVTQKFNMLAVLNQICREAIKVCSFQDPKNNEDSDEDPDAILQKAESSDNLKPMQPFLSTESLNAIKDQYARLKYQGSTFNMKLVNKLIGNQIPMFNQFSVDIRNQMFVKSHLRTILVEVAHPEVQPIDVEALNSDHIFVILNGNMLIQERHLEHQKEKVVERYERGKKVEVIIPPGPPLEKWVTNQVLGPGMAIPVQHLKWLLEKKPEYRIIANKDPNSEELEYECTHLDIDYLEYDKRDLADLVFAPVLHSLLKKVELIQNVDIFNGDTPAASSRLETLSPYVMFSLAALCKVQVYNMNELLIEQDEIPKAMFVILEGQAKTVYEDTLKRKGEVCPYSRRSLRTDLPKELRFGMKDFNSHKNGPIKTSKNQLNENGDNLVLNNDLTKVQSSREVDKVNKKAMQQMSTTFHNLVHNSNWTEHQPAKSISFRHHIEFGFLTEGHYVASRVVLDEGAIKNFIKSSKHKVKEWLEANQQQVRTPVTQTMKAGYIQMASAEKEIRETQESRQSNNSSILSIENEPNDFTGTHNSSTPAGGLHLKNPLGGLSSFAQLKEGLQVRLQHYETQLDMHKLKQYLMSSQLSVVVTSSTLKAMVIYKSDKAYFNEPVKKLLTEMIQDRDFLDVDRPMEEGKNLDFIRNTQKQWEQFKYKFEEHSLRESFHQKYEVFPR